MYITSNRPDQNRRRISISDIRTLWLSSLGSPLEFYDFIIFVFFAVGILDQGRAWADTAPGTDTHCYVNSSGEARSVRNQRKDNLTQQGIGLRNMQMMSIIEAMAVTCACGLAVVITPPFFGA